VSASGGRQLLDSVLDQLPAGILEISLDARLVGANAEALRLFGLRRSDVLGAGPAAFAAVAVSEDGTPWLPEELPVMRVLATGEAQGPFVVGIRHSNGEIMWALTRAIPARNGDGELTGAVVTLMDVTERKRAEEALRRSEDAWRSLAENLPDHVVVLDREGRIRSVNRNLSEARLAAIIGTEGYSLIDPEFMDEGRAKLEAVLASGTPVSFEMRALGLNQRYRWYESRLIPIRENGRIERVLVVAHDITERREMMAQLAERERLASIGMLSASVAHEIMNPLTSVLAHLDFAMSDRCPSGARMLKELRDAREVAGRMQQIVRDLRTLGRRETEELFYVDVRSVIETALRLAGPQIAHGIMLRVELSDIPDVLASESRLCQVLINLLVNAGQSVSAQAEGARVIRVRTRADAGGDSVGIDVEDTGSGIAPEHLGRIFEPFFTTRDAGTGLGLSIARASMERMGGRLEVESRPGELTTFTVWLSTTRVPRNVSSRPSAT
jgi:PAS domain S-box-containing protein